MSEVLMRDANTVLINGTPAGGVVEAVLNNRDDAAAIHDAFTAWLDRHRAELVAAEQAKATEEARVVAAHAAEAAAGQQAQIDKLQATIEALTSMKDQFRAKAEELATQLQQVVGANQKLDAKVQELQGQLGAAMNLAQQAVMGTTEQAVAAARELTRLRAIGDQAASAAQLAEHERLASA